MAITYVGGQTAGRTNPSSAVSVDFSLSGGSDATPRAGDLVVVTAVTGSAAGNPAMAVTTPSGYSALGQLNQSAVTADTSMNVSWKFLNGTPDTAVTIPGTGNNAFGEAYSIQVFRGVSNCTRITPTSAGATGTGRPNPASIVPTKAGSWTVICGGGAAGTGANYTAPANYTTNFLTTFGTDTTDAMVGSGYRSDWSSGTEDPAVYTGGTTGANDSWTSYTLVLEPSVVDDGEVSWWSGTNLNSVAVPIAGAAAALALSVAIGSSFNKNEEYQFPETLGHSESQQVVVVGAPPRGYAFVADDEFAPQQAAPALEEGEWRPPQLGPPRAAPTVFSADEQIVPQPVTFTPDEDYWLQLRADTSTVRIVDLEAGAGIGAVAVVPMVDEEYWWSLPTVVRVLPVTYRPADDQQIVPQPAGFVPDEDYWFRLGTAVSAVTIVDLEAGAGIGAEPPAATFVPNEDYWFRLGTAVNTVTIVDLEAGAGIGAEPPAATFVPNEDYWLQLRADPSQVTIVNWEIGAGLGAEPPAAPTFVPNEDYWLQPRIDPRQVIIVNWEIAAGIAPVEAEAAVGGEISGAFDQRALEPTSLWQWPIVDEFPPIAAPDVEGETSGAFDQRALEPTTLWQWAVVDELPQAIPPAFESDWQVYTPALVAKKPLYQWQHEDEWEIPPPPLQVDDLFWPPMVTAIVPPTVTLWEVEDESMDWFAPPVVTTQPSGPTRKQHLRYKQNAEVVMLGVPNFSGTSREVRISGSAEGYARDVSGLKAVVEVYGAEAAAAVQLAGAAAMKSASGVFDFPQHVAVWLKDRNIATSKMATGTLAPSGGATAKPTVRRHGTMSAGTMSAVGVSNPSDMEMATLALQLIRAQRARRRRRRKGRV